MSAPWLHVERLPDAASAAGELVALDPNEVRHAAGARRLRDGDEVILFDGRGAVAAARLDDRGRGCRVLSLRSVAPPEPQVAIAAAIPKGDRSAVMVDMATQMGLTMFVPLRCQRSVVEPSPTLIERLRRVAIEACKQSQRAHVPEICDAASLDELLDASGAGAGAACDGRSESPSTSTGTISTGTTPTGTTSTGTTSTGDRFGVGRSALAARVGRGRLLLADPAGVRASMERARAVPGAGWLVLIGPEGGFTEEETARARDAGAIAVSLGDGILRVETAAVAAVQALRGA